MFYDRYNARDRGREGIDFSEHPSLTKQSFKQECDLNTIMKKYLTTGTIPQGTSMARYGDFSEAEDFYEAQLVILQAESQFSALPSSVRERFKNNPALLLEFIENKDNLAEAQKLGLLKKEAPAPTPASDKEPDLEGAKKDAK